MVFSLSQVSSSVPMGKNASHKSECVTGKMTVWTDLMKLTAQLWLRAAISAVIIILAAYQRASCVMEREIVLMGQMRKTVVGAFQKFQKSKACKHEITSTFIFLFPGLVSCADHQYRCVSGQCVSEALRCDGYADCSDGSDELHCSRPPRCLTQLRCPHTHECLQKEWLCDGEDDCQDGSDEKVGNESQVHLDLSS